MVARIQGLLQQRGERYAAADLRVSLAAGPGSEPDAGAPAEVVTWRRATCSFWPPTEAHCMNSLI